MKSYSSYKDSGVEWIGEIPIHWDRTFIKNLVDIKITDGPHLTPNWIENGVPFLSVESIQNSRIDFSKRRGDVSLEDHKEYSKKCKPILNDILLVKSGSVGKLCIVETDIEFNVWSPLCLIRISEKGLSKYYYYFFHSKYFQTLLKLNCGVNTQPNIGMGVIENLKVLCPIKDEQTQIVSFLDTKTQKIDELIEKTEQKIKLLKEKRTSLINHCVTKGLNPNVKMKDIGVEWIGEIPIHWEVKPIKYISDYNQDSLGTDTSPDYELDYLEISDVNSVGKISNPTHYTFSKSPSRCRRILKKNDIIISTVRTYLRSIGFIEDEVQNLICSTGFCVLSPNDIIKPKLLFYLVRSEWFISDVISQSVGVSYPGIQTEKLMGIKILLPPTNEQNQIVEYLDEQTEKIDSTIKKETQRIELLKEYRQSLISEVVTGKVDVRDWDE